MKDWIAAGLAAAALGIVFGPLLLARHSLVKRHKEQFVATGSQEFPLPSARSFEAPAPQTERAETFRRIADTDTGELIVVDAEGVPVEQESDRPAPHTEFTVDTERLAEILQLEKTGEYLMNAATWVECDAAEQWAKDPLGSPLLPPVPLVEAAGNPALADTFYALLGSCSLTTDWSDADSEFRFWDSDIALAGPAELTDDPTEELAAMVDAYRVEVTR